MPALITKDKRELILDCKCGCDDAIKFIVDLEDADHDIIMFTTFLTGKWFTNQETCKSRFINKIKRIWGVLRNKDYCYAEQVLSKDDFRVFKEFINQFDL